MNLGKELMTPQQIILIVTTIRNGLNILGVYAFWQYVVNGLIIITAVAMDQIRRRN